MVRTNRIGQVRGLSLEHLITQLGGKPRSFAEIHYEIQQAKQIGNTQRVATLQLYLASLYECEGAHLIAEKYLTSTQESPSFPTSSAPLSTKYEFSPIETELVQALASGPKNRYELIDALYGATSDVSAGENRLKNILHRIRSRYPELIRYKRGRYELSPEAFNSKP